MDPNLAPVDCHGIPIKHRDPAFPYLGIIRMVDPPKRYFDLASTPGQVVVRYQYTDTEIGRFSYQELKSTYWSRVAFRVGYTQTIVPTVEIVS